MCNIHITLLSDMPRAKECQWAERQRLRSTASVTLSTLSGVRTVSGQPGFVWLVADAVVLKFLTQFKMVWHVGTVPLLPMLKWHLNSCCVIVVADSLFLKKKNSTANTRRSLDQHAMATGGFELLYKTKIKTARYVSADVYGGNFKLSNEFCCTLYFSL